MGFKQLRIAAFWVLSAASPFAIAQTTALPAAPGASISRNMTDGEIRKIDKDAKKVTLKHGPIKNLDMPGMTMAFQVRDQALMDKLARLAIGDKIKFSAVQQQGALVVTSAEKAGTP